MKLYCFLLLIILICLVYDNKLYEGNDHTYDTSQDNTRSYDENREAGDGGILNLSSYLGAGGLPDPSEVLKDPTTLVTGGTTQHLKDYYGSPITCDLYENKCLGNSQKSQDVNCYSIEKIPVRNAYNIDKVGDGYDSCCEEYNPLSMLRKDIKITDTERKNKIREILKLDNEKENNLKRLIR